MKKHYIHLYYGLGKGKTTAAFGLALRALGQGKKVVFIQWLKGRKDIGEVKIASKLKPKFKMYQFGPKYFTWDPPGPSEHKKLALKGLEFLESLITKGGYDVLVLDELIDAVEMKFISKTKTIDLIKKAVKKGEVILTGHKVPKKFMELADLITEMRKVKHYYDKGQLARKGIEF